MSLFLKDENGNYVFEGEEIPLDKLPIPTGYHVLIGMIKVAQQSAGGIIISDTSQRQEQYRRIYGKVLAVGKDCYQSPKFNAGNPINSTVEHWVKVGDIVALYENAGEKIEFQDSNGQWCCLKVVLDDQIKLAVPDVSYYLDKA
jgi:co-chaperonin GroES (HSP10)